MAKTIGDYKKDYAAAKAAGDAAGMKAANDGANAIRASMGQAAQVASNDISKVAASSSSGNKSTTTSSSSGSSSSGSKYTGSSSSYGGSSSSSSSGSYSGSYGYSSDRDPNTGLSPTTPSKPLDSAYYDAQKLYSSMYNTAKANGDWKGMQDANDMMNMVRNEYGLTAQKADNDIASAAIQGGVTPIWVGGSSGGSYGGTSSGTLTGSSGSYPTVTMPGGSSQESAVNDMSNYLEEMYAAQRKAALASINSAYQQNLNAINSSMSGIGSQYQNARNQAAGASELAARNFAEYASAAGLGAGTSGQAELARNIALQNNLSSLSTEEANAYAEIELQKSNAETEYNNAIAQAEASNDSALAASLYEEKVRVQNELIAEQQRLFENSLAQQQLAFQQQQADISNQQWQQTFDQNSAESSRQNLAAYGSAFLEQGLMPSQEMLNAMGITQADAQAYIDRLSLMASLSQASGSSSASSSDRSSPGNTSSSYSSEISYDTPGPGMNESYFRAAMNTISTQLQGGKNMGSLQSSIDSMWPELNESQRNSFRNLLNMYGYSYTP